MLPRMSKLRTAMTLVELLVVMAIIGALFHLLLPAVQASRERGRRATCQNHLKQLATATQLHLDAHKFFPSGGWSGAYLADPHRGYGRQQPGGWLFSLLEFMEESSLRSGAAGDKLEDYPLGEALVSLYQSAPTTFYCPSRRRAKSYPFKQAGNGRWSLSVAESVLLLSGVTKSDYAANSGDSLQSATEPFSNEPAMWSPGNYAALNSGPQNWSITSNPQSRFFQTGTIYYRSELKPAQVTDGLSKTYLCGEKFLSPKFYDDVNPSNDVGMMGDNQSAWVGYEWDNHRVAYNPKSMWPKAAYQPRQDAPNSNFKGVFAFGSAHPDALNMAYCEGSVQTVSYDIDEQVHRQQANRLDGN